jgi:catechol 2,3-dioxygenase-like lactoylglutathione lyase family enzyme
MLNGAHSIIYSTNAEADRAFLRDVLALPHVDVGHGWLIFGLPPAEVAVHPSEENNIHELYFMCDDVEATVRDLRARGVEFTQDISEERWGRLTRFRLPGGGEVGMYEPRHPRAIDL